MTDTPKFPPRVWIDEFSLDKECQLKLVWDSLQKCQNHTNCSVSKAIEYLSLAERNYDVFIAKACAFEEAANAIRSMPFGCCREDFEEFCNGRSAALRKQAEEMK